jgi:hypothetical protein
VRVWDVETGACLHWLLAPHSVRYVAFSSDGELLACHTVDSDADYPLTVWDITTGRLVRGFTWNAWDIAFAPDRKVLAATVTEGTEWCVDLRNVESGELLHRIRMPPHRLYRGIAEIFGFSPDGKKLGLSVFQSDMPSGAVVWDTTTGEQMLYVHKHRFLGFPDDNHVLVRGNPDGASIIEVELRTGSRVETTMPPWEGGSRAFNRESNTLVTISAGGWQAWRIPGGELLCEMPRIRPYEGINIAGASGLSSVQRALLKNLGAIEEDVPHSETPSADAAARRTHAVVFPSGDIVRRFRLWAGGPRALVSIVQVSLASPADLANRLARTDRVTRMRMQLADRQRHMAAGQGGATLEDSEGTAFFAFRTPVEALGFALALRDDTGVGRIQVCTTIHFGFVDIEVENSLHDLMAFARSLSARTGASEIWCSQAFKDLLEQHGPCDKPVVRWNMHPNCRLEGYPGSHLLWSVTADSPGFSFHA